MDERIAAIAARRHGVFTRTQAIRCGATAGALKWRLKVGRWERIHRNVYRLAGAPQTWRQKAVAACLFYGPSASISHRAAAAMRSLIPSKRPAVELTMSRNRHRSRSPGIKIHIMSDPIPAEDITVLDGIPVTKPARTLLDLAAVEPENLIERALDDALRRRLVSLAFLERWLADPRRKRHPGARVLRRLVEQRAIIGVTESPLEREVLRLLRAGGLPIPMLQYVIEDRGRFVGRVDFAYPEQRVAIEVDGFRYHDTRTGFDDERARGNDLQTLGWRVLRITAKHVEQDADAVLAWVRRALDQGEGY